jgi:hypothetical protein
MSTEAHAVTTKDAAILRGLAERVARAATSPENRERKDLWFRHHAGERTRPLVLAEVGGVMAEAMPDSILECSGTWARGVEMGLRVALYEHDVLQDDHVIEPWLRTNWKVTVGPFVDESEVHVHRADNAGKLGARTWDAPIRDMRRDAGKLRRRELAVDREGTLAEKERLEKVFQGIMPVRIRGGFWWTMGMTWNAIDLIGLEGLMLMMYDDPDGLHRLMQYLCDEHLRYAEWLEAEGLLTLNNENDYIGSGSMGYARDLPAPGANGKVRLRDLWVLLESQETVGVGPEQFAEFIFPYQLRIAERFGACYYGCCEPVHNRWHVVRDLPRLRRVSVSPWADEEMLARELKGKYVYSRKPAPSQISTAVFDEEAIRRDARHTFDVARGCNVEIIMKDVHTLANQPERLARWVRIAREEGERGA